MKGWPDASSLALLLMISLLSLCNWLVGLEEGTEEEVGETESRRFLTLGSTLPASIKLLRTWGSKR